MIESPNLLDDAALARILGDAPLAGVAERLVQGGRFVATMLPTAEGLAFGVKVR